MSQIPVKGMLFDAALAPLLPRMDSVNNHREALQRLQDSWDHLTLLGQMSGIAADITTTGEGFKTLSGKLLNTLAQRLLDNLVQTLRGKAQVAVDILVRNLFERTADVGFLATDSAVRQALAAGLDAVAAQQALGPRLQAYVAKYSVYDDVIVLGSDGTVLARLDETAAARHCGHDVLHETLNGKLGFVERFERQALLDGRRALTYAAPIRDARAQTLGALVLSFRLDDEMAGIFTHLIDGDPFQLLLLCDARGEVIASSDALRIPVGERLAIDPDRAGHQCICFAGRLYLAVATRSNGYQGYMGPGWLGCALVPLEAAFDTTLARLGRLGMGEGARASDALAIDASAFFDEALQAIPRQAHEIQKGLERSVWNWELHARHHNDAQSGVDPRHSTNGSDGTRFAAALLQQVSLTGERIRLVFEQAITELGESVAASVLRDLRFRASLAIDIMDRNLYERANDCRWWSLDGSLREALRCRDGATQRQACEVLAHINSLYTVYARLVLFDAQGEVVAISGGDAQEWLGRQMAAPWLDAALRLTDHQAWAKSDFEPSPLYGDRPTYVYAAAVHDDAGRTLGAIAIVFDAAPQFEAMLRDALPAPHDGAGQHSGAMAALYVTRAGLVVASTDARFEAGSALPLPHAAWEGLLSGQSRGEVFDIDRVPHAAGIVMAAGYREYRGACQGKAEDVLAMLLLPLHQPAQRTGDEARGARVVIPPSRPAPGDRTLATFLSAGQHIGIEAQQVIEALPHRRLTAVPGSPAHLAGLLLHQERMLPVVDLRTLRGHGAAPDDSGRMVVVCSSRDGFRFALLVDELAGILTVPAQALHALPEGMDRHDPAAEAIVRGQEQGPHRAMMTVLDADRLAGCLHGRQVA